ncbi:MAG: Fumarylacetoacetate hydrolase family protein, partial [uncultured Solirubrobacterales bacterium]
APGHLRRRVGPPRRRPARQGDRRRLEGARGRSAGRAAERAGAARVGTRRGCRGGGRGVGGGGHSGERPAAPAADSRPGQADRHRPQLPLARRRGGARPAGHADLLRQVPQRPRRPRRRGSPARCEREGRLRGGGRLRGRPPRPRCRRGRRVGPHRRLHPAERPLGPRPPDGHAAVDAGQGLRRLGPLRTGPRHPRRGRPVRRHRDRARAQRRDHAAGLDGRPDPPRPGAAGLPLRPDDPRARRRRLHGHAGGGREPAPPARVARARRRARRRLAPARAPRDPDRL